MRYILAIVAALTARREERGRQSRGMEEERGRQSRGMEEERGRQSRGMEEERGRQRRREGEERCNKRERERREHCPVEETGYNSVAALVTGTRISLPPTDTRDTYVDNKLVVYYCSEVVHGRI